MRAVIKEAPGPGFALGTVPDPVPAPGEVVLRVEAASICGTDVHLYEWNPWAAGRVRPPRVMGHEMCGEVVAQGDGATTRLGSRVAVETHLVCGHCPECRRGDFHVCANTRILGVDVDGVFAEYVSVPAHNTWPLASGLTPELGALMEPFGNAVHACSYGRLRSQVVAVFGCGPIGCMCVGIAKAEGAAKVIAVDRNPYRLDLAMQMGADVAVDAADGDEAILSAGGGPLDCALEMSGAPAAVATATRVTRPGGWISLLGIGDAPATLDLSRDVVMKGLTLYGVTGRRMFSTWEQTSAYLAGGRIDVSPILTHRLPLAGIDQAIALMRTGRSGKVVLDPRDARAPQDVRPAAEPTSSGQS
jgi:threonine 3-dehydrogenase